VDYPLPVLVQGIVATQVSAGDGLTCAVTVTHTADWWGDSNFGELGDGTIGGIATAPVTAGLTTDGLLGASGSQGGTICGLNASQQASCWGGNSVGELGAGTTADSGSPVPAQGL
jgi:hypothetical protein